MGAPSYTYTLTNGSTADASQVMQDFNDILNGVTDGTKDLSISALTAAGTANLKGQVNLGDATSDDIQFNGSLATTVNIKTDATYDIGTSTKGIRTIYFGANSQRAAITGSASMSATWTLTLPVTAGTANYILGETSGGSGATEWKSLAVGTAGTDFAVAHAANLVTFNLPDASAANRGAVTTGTQTFAGAKTFSTSVTFANGGTALTWYEEGTFTPTVAATGTSGTITYGTQVGSFTRIGRTVRITIYVTWTNWTGSPTGVIQLGGLPYTQKNTANLLPTYVVITDNVVMPSGTLWICGQGSNNAATINLAAAKATPGVSSANSVSIDPASNSGSATRGVFLTGTYEV